LIACEEISFGSRFRHHCGISLAAAIAGFLMFGGINLGH
jgi:hypothetical protein